PLNPRRASWAGKGSCGFRSSWLPRSGSPVPCAEAAPMIRCTDLPTFSDADLIALARRGDGGEAWAELVARYRRFALKVARKTLARGGKAAVADDDEVAWDAMSKAYEKLHLFEPSRPFSCWLGAIVRNTALDRLRQAHRRRHVSLDLVAAAAPPADALV